MTSMTLPQDDVAPVVEAIYARGQSVVGVKCDEGGRVELTVSSLPARSVLWVPIAANPSTAVGVVPLLPGALTSVAPPGARHDSRPLLTGPDSSGVDTAEGRA